MTHCLWCRRERENNKRRQTRSWSKTSSSSLLPSSVIIFYLSSTPDEDHGSKMLVFLIVLYMSSYRWVHFSRAVLFYELNLFLFFKAASFLFSFFLQPTVQQGYPNGNSLLAKHWTHTVHAHEKATFSSLRCRIVHLGTVHFFMQNRCILVTYSNRRP